MSEYISEARTSGATRNAAPDAFGFTQPFFSNPTAISCDALRANASHFAGLNPLSVCALA